MPHKEQIYDGRISSSKGRSSFEAFLAVLSREDQDKSRDLLVQNWADKVILYLKQNPLGNLAEFEEFFVRGFNEFYPSPYESREKSKSRAKRIEKQPGEHLAGFFKFLISECRNNSEFHSLLSLFLKLYTDLAATTEQRGIDGLNPKDERGRIKIGIRVDHYAAEETFKDVVQAELSSGAAAREEFEEPPTEKLRIGEIVIYSNNFAYYKNRKVFLGTKEQEILKFLSNASDETLTTAEVAQVVYHKSFERIGAAAMYQQFLTALFRLVRKMTELGLPSGVITISNKKKEISLKRVDFSKFLNGSEQTDDIIVEEQLIG